MSILDEELPRELTLEVARHELQGMRVCDEPRCADPSLHVGRVGERVVHACDMHALLGVDWRDEPTAAHVRRLLALAALS